MSFHVQKANVPVYAWMRDEDEKDVYVKQEENRERWGKIDNKKK